jgi:P4 family phage/plasmid primase-like protien
VSHSTSDPANDVATDADDVVDAPEETPEAGPAGASEAGAGPGPEAGAGAGPYASAARRYRDAGWRGVLPADLGGRPGHVPAGYSGGWDRDPDDDQVANWVQTLADHNVALRLPDDVVGLDVDVYDGKRGDQTIDYAAYEAGLGELPPTWTSTARGPDQRSRIYLFRVPAGRRWRSDLGRGSAVEIIQRGHRWVRCWPSQNHRLAGRPGVDATYRWYRPDGTVADRPPRPDELAELPSSWLTVLAGADAVRPDGVGGSSADRDGRSALDHRNHDGPVLDQDGQPVDPELVLEVGLPIGSQQTELFRYMCSLRARNLRRSEMLVLGMVALQRLANDPSRDPWTQQDVRELVDRVRREYAPGAGTAQLDPAAQAFVDRLQRAGSADDGSRLITSIDEPPLAEESATDMGNSLRFARLFADRVRYAEDLRRWYVWDGRRWAPDREALRVVELTKYVVDDVRRQGLVDVEHAADWARWATQSESLARRRATVDGAASEPGITTTSESFDRDPDLLVVRNGTVDLRTGQLRPSRPNDLCSQLAEVRYDADATYERWAEHVAFVCAGDEELQRYLARAVGYSLTGGVGARKFFFLEGKGTNGKNAFIEPIMMMLGTYAQTAAPSLLTGTEDQHPAVLADLLGARLVFVDETKKDKALNTERIKALTGSRLIKAAFKHKDYFDFEARFKLWIAGNGRPKMNDESDGVWKRLNRVVCRGVVDPARQIDRYGDVLYQQEASGILNWALAGLVDYQRNGLATPRSVELAVEEYRHDENYVQQFAEEFLDVTGDQEDRLTSNELYVRYQLWCAEMGLRGVDVKNRVHFSRELGQLDELGEDRGVRRDERTIQGVKTRGFVGLRWRSGVVPLGG